MPHDERVLFQRNCLIVGDVHAIVDELEDVARLFDLIEKKCKEHKVDEVLFMGDLHHHFSITNIKVTAFYQERFARLKKYVTIRAMKGNHDMAGDGSNYHALISYPQIEVVDKPVRIGAVLYMPYIADPNLFIRICKEECDKGTNLVFCHQEFNGAKYDNGMFIPHGADPALVQAKFISGHIHTPQSFGNVWYVGAPRWRTLSDANIDRFLHIVYIDHLTGDYEVRQEISTRGVCKAIHFIEVIEGQETEDKTSFLYEIDDVRMRIEGSANFVLTKRITIEELNKNIKISTVVRSDKIKVKESEGIPKAFKKFVSEFKPKFGTSVPQLEKLARERIWPNQA